MYMYVYLGFNLIKLLINRETFGSIYIRRERLKAQREEERGETRTIRSECSYYTKLQVVVLLDARFYIDLH